MIPHAVSRKARATHGFVLPFGLLVISLLLSMTGASLIRSVTALSTSTRTIEQEQAFHLAEGGLDRKLAELRDSTTANDQLAIPANAPSGWVTVSASPLLRYQVQVDATNPALWLVNSTGMAGSLTQQLRFTVAVGPPPVGLVPGAYTLVRDPTRGTNWPGLDFYYKSTLGKMVVDGCDAQNPTSCLPGIMVTSDKKDKYYTRAIEDLTETEQTFGWFGNLLVGAKSDWTGTKYYSIQPAPPGYLANGGWGFDRMNDLAVFAKTHADPTCNINYKNDDTSGNDSGSSNTGGEWTKYVTLKNRTLGTVAQPKLCYAEFPFNYAGGTIVSGQPDSNSKVIFRGTNTGAGVLVIKGEFFVPDDFTYQGLIVVVGPEGTANFRGSAVINGGLLMGTTEPYSNKTTYYATQTELAGEGRLTYDSKAIAMAANLLTKAGWAGMPVSGGGSGSGSGSSPTVRSWTAVSKKSP